jgi:hypothetical protein
VAIATETILFDVHDCKVWPMLTDATGASPTYGAAVDVFGISQVGVDPNMVTAELKGDARVIAKKGRLDRVNVNATYGKLSLDVLDVILNATVTAGGSGSTETQTGTLQGGIQLPYFKFAAQIQDVDLGIGDLTVVAYKCQVTGGSLVGVQTDQFGQPNFTAEGISVDGTIGGLTGVIADLILHETVTALT